MVIEVNANEHLPKPSASTSRTHVLGWNGACEMTAESSFESKTVRNDFYEI
jgi:hypothetical protein